MNLTLFYFLWKSFEILLSQIIETFPIENARKPIKVIRIDICSEKQSFYSNIYKEFTIIYRVLKTTGAYT